MIIKRRARTRHWNGTSLVTNDQSFAFVLA
jgi:hypothetical protein